MKKMIYLGTFIVLTMLMTGPVFSQTADEYKIKIAAMNSDMRKYMLEGNTEKNLELYANDAISLPNNEPMLEGLPAIRKANEEMVKSGMKITSFEPTIVKVIPNGNLITEIGTYKISLSAPGTDQPMNEQGKYVTIWEKQNDGSLKIKVETWNSDQNPMEQK